MIKRWLYVLATGFTLVFFSELVFWGAESLAGFVGTWLFYSLMTYVILAVIARFGVNTIWSLFFVGAFYGWLTEGVLVQTAYDNLPYSISNTGLSWHALITIWVGWYVMRRALLAQRSTRTLIVGLGIGVFWGLWIPFWAFDLSMGMAPYTMERMLLLTSTAVPVLTLSYWLQNRLTPTPFTPHKIEIGLIVGLLLLQFFFTAVPIYPIALILLPLLLLLIYLGLRRHRQTAPAGDDFIQGLAGQVRPLNYLSVLIIIPAALAAFAFDQTAGLTPIPAYVIYAITVPAGFLLFILSLITIYRRHLTVPGRTL